MNRKGSVGAASSRPEACRASAARVCLRHSSVVHNDRIIRGARMPDAGWVEQGIIEDGYEPHSDKALIVGIGLVSKAFSMRRYSIRPMREFEQLRKEDLITEAFEDKRTDISPNSDPRNDRHRSCLSTRGD